MMSRGMKNKKREDTRPMKTLVMLRHGESLWNQENRFTGWTDVDLDETGIQEAHKAGKMMKAEGFVFDIAFTSVLKRAIRTLWISLTELDLMWIPVNRSWRLNERHYGALQGCNKKDTAAEFGKEQVRQWRRSYAVRPPALSLDDKRHPRFDPRYKGLNEKELPATECLEDTVKRIAPYWQQCIVPALENGQKPILVAHGNTLRALAMILDKMPEDEISGLNIPTGVPLVYELDNELAPLKHYYLGNQEEIERATAAVRDQGK